MKKEVNCIASGILIGSIITGSIITMYKNYRINNIKTDSYHLAGRVQAIFTSPETKEEHYRTIKEYAKKIGIEKEIEETVFAPIKFHISKD